MNCTSKVKVIDVFPQNTMLTREVASQLVQRIRFGTPCRDIRLDFEGIHFISRSFADQFHKEKVQLFEANEKEIIVENAEPDVFQMFQAVSKTQQDTNRAYHSYKVVPLNSRRFAKHYLSSIL